MALSKKVRDSLEEASSNLKMLLLTQQGMKNL